MATQYVCDRCLKIKDTRSTIITVSIPRGEFESSSNRDYDLCDSCMRDLRRFLEPLPQVAKP